MTADRFSNKTPTEVITVGFDFSRLLITGETISTATVTAVVSSGTDSAPENIIDGSESIAGSLVSQMITGGVNGVDYVLSAFVTTSQGNAYQEIGYLHVATKP